jgi:hypothetical protein
MPRTNWRQSGWRSAFRSSIDLLLSSAVGDGLACTVDIARLAADRAVDPYLLQHLGIATSGGASAVTSLFLTGCPLSADEGASDGRSGMSKIDVPAALN